MVSELRYPIDFYEYASRGFPTEMKAAVGDWPMSPSSVIKSAGRTLRVLEFFDDVRRSACMMEVSRALGYPLSSTSILLRSLVTLGYLEYDSCKRTFHPTNRVRLLGNWIDPSLFRDDAVLRLMNRVNQESSDTVMLASRNGLYAQYIHVVQARTSVRLHVTVGTARPIAASVPGYGLLSRIRDSEIAKMVRRLNAEDSSLEEPLKLAEVLDHVSNVRRDGYVFANSILVRGASVLAMPLAAGLSRMPLTIAIGGLTAQLEPRREELIDLLKCCIREELAA